MKYVVKMMIPWQTEIEAYDMGDADRQARRLMASRDDDKGNHTVVLLSVWPADTQDWDMGG